ncbi:MAG TPA: hypothetical protein VE152_10880, partial [Acidimicrobiales bacterium]|nr:hypothetical protein [Acidimicrobiales bacterium]
MMGPAARRARWPRAVFMFTGALVFTGLVTTLAQPAEAGSLPPPTVAITGPARGAVVGAVGTVVRGTVTPNGCLPGAPGQDTFNLNLTLSPSAGQPPRSLTGHTAGPAACGPSGHPVPETFSVGLPNLDSSGAWKVMVKASQRGPVSSSSSRPATTAVSVPPAAPRQVATHLLGGGSGRPAVVVAWAPGPEPDIASYNVLRRSGGTWRVVGTTAATSYRDPGVTGGNRYAYRVVATRRGV